MFPRQRFFPQNMESKNSLNFREHTKSLSFFFFYFPWFYSVILDLHHFLDHLSSTNFFLLVCFYTAF